MVTSVFSPLPLNDIETKLQTRTYIYGQSSNVLVLDSPFADTRLILTNNLRANGTSSNIFAISASNEFFKIQKDNIVFAQFDDKLNIPRLIVPGGRIESDRFTIGSNEVRKAIVLRDFNAVGTHQFAGMGYAAGILNYQIPTANAVHAFYAGFDATSSLELMRVQRKDNYTQVGIGTTFVRNGVALDVLGGVHVSSNLTVDGNLHVTGNIDFSGIQGVATLNPLTQKVESGVLPEKLLYLNNTNQIDVSYLPAVYNGPYLRGLRNVGIGTRNPIQKLHVIGTTVTSERLGVGTFRPAARLHINDSNVTTPSLRIDKPFGEGSDAIVVYGLSNRVAFNVTASGAVGIGVYNNNANTLRIAGGLQLDGKVSIDQFEWKSHETGVAYMSATQATLSDGTIEDVLQAHIPFQAEQRLVTPEIRYGGRPTDITSSNVVPNVRFKSSGIHVDLDAIFERPPITISDARVKCNIKRVSAPMSALDKIHGYTYSYCKDLAHGASGTGIVSAGLLAQEVERGFPTAVAHLEDGRLAVRYDSVLALLLEGFHELKQTVKALEAKIDRMR